MRGTVPGLASPYSFGTMLPAVYQEDDFTMRWMSAFDEVLAPCVSSIDNIEHYFDPDVAPPDFVEMLAWWVGVELDETWSDRARRELVSQAAALYRVRGTVAGLRRHVAIYAGSEPEIEESGGVAVSEQPGGALPGSADPHLVVRVHVDEHSPVDQRRLSRLVASAKPAHIPHRVEVVRPSGTSYGASDGAEPGPDGIATGLDELAAPQQPHEPGEEPAAVELSGVAMPETSEEPPPLLEGEDQVPEGWPRHVVGDDPYEAGSGGSDGSS